MKCLHLSRQSYSLDRCEQVERSKIMHQKCEKKFTKILLCLFSSVAKMFDNKGNSFWVFHSTTVTHNSKPGIIFYCITGDWMPNLSNLVHTCVFHCREMMKSWHPSLPSFNPFVIVYYFLFRRLAKRDANAYAYPDYGYNVAAGLGGYGAPPAQAPDQSPLE